MNDLRIIVLSVVCVLLFAPAVSAQKNEQYSHSYPIGLRIYGGFGLPGGALSDPYINAESGLNRNPGFEVGGVLDFHITNRLAIGPEINYSSYPDREYNLGELNNHFNVLKLGGRLQYTLFTGKVHRSFAILGSGVASAKISKFALDADTREILDLEYNDKPYVYVGGGVIFMLSPNFSLVGEIGIDFLLLKGSKLNINDGVLVDEDSGEPLEVSDNYYILDFKFGFGFNL
ncbi:MAG: outer membrane beta-barrel protein [candidate division Zixibacteria bacterium]|nr:outer membrane beta-barrel protein [candidate division Zixibacteria bacterium]